MDFSMKMALSEFVSVSYTHLDVYKRQVKEQTAIQKQLPAPDILQKATNRVTELEHLIGCLLYTSRCV